MANIIAIPKKYKANAVADSGEMPYFPRRFTNENSLTPIPDIDTGIEAISNTRLLTALISKNVIFIPRKIVVM
jgi:hypothetical protein